MSKWNKKKDYNNYLVCKKVKFYSFKDEDAFFWWIKNMDSIKSFEAAGDELYLDIIDRDLENNELKDLIGLLYRYNIDMKQLAQFLTPTNKSWFADPKKYWHKKVFGDT